MIAPDQLEVEQQAGVGGDVDAISIDDWSEVQLGLTTVQVRLPQGVPL